MIRFNLLLLLFILIFSCGKRDHSLEKALAMAGPNKVQLDSVLSYYQNDSLKLKAAKYLIRNMPHHYSYKDTTYFRSFYNQIDSMSKKYRNDEISGEERDSLFKSIVEKYYNSLDTAEIVYDIQEISAHYLIDNIEKSFIVWDKSNWASHISFDQFCEFILPYKVFECQDLDNWRDYFLNFCDGALRDHKYCELYKYSSYKACETVNNSLRDYVKPKLVNDYSLPIKKLNVLAELPFGLCEDYAVLAVALMRAKGIPCAVDFTPQWPFRSLGHSWCVLLENSGKMVVFEGASGAPASPHKQDHKMAKVFRKTYKINPEIEELNAKEKYVPHPFDKPFIQDVTHDYLTTINLDIHCPPTQKNEYAYLAVFDNQKWVPVHWSKKSGDTYKFDNLGKNVVYLPVLFNQDGTKPFHHPILISISGEKIIIKPDTIIKQNLKLNRKYPPFENIYNIAHRVVGGKFQVATDSLFSDSLTIHTIKEMAVTSKSIELDINKSYRYWRYYSPNDAFCNMAEIYFYEKNTGKEIKGKIIGTKGSFRSDGKHGIEAVFDRDALTFFDAPHSNDCWVGVDFETPVNIKDIIYLPRNDGNCVEIGDKYELLYWDENRWHSLGVKNADNIILEYNNCPTNALFLLHNHTKGIEERIFTYESGQQTWW